MHEKRYKIEYDTHLRNIIDIFLKNLLVIIHNLVVKQFIICVKNEKKTRQ